MIGNQNIGLLRQVACLIEVNTKTDFTVLPKSTCILAQSSNWLVMMESIFQETWNIKEIEKNEFQIGSYSSFKITKIYFQKKSLCFGGNWKVPYQNMRLEF